MTGTTRATPAGLRVCHELVDMKTEMHKALKKELEHSH